MLDQAHTRTRGPKRNHPEVHAPTKPVSIATTSHVGVMLLRLALLFCRCLWLRRVGAVSPSCLRCVSAALARSYSVRASQTVLPQSLAPSLGQLCGKSDVQLATAAHDAARATPQPLARAKDRHHAREPRTAASRRHRSVLPSPTRADAARRVTRADRALRQPLK